MILGQDRLDQLMHGYLEQGEVNGYKTYYRFTKRQRDYYAETEFAAKENASAGMILETITDATGFRFEYELKKASGRTDFFFDLFIDGILWQHFGQTCASGSAHGSFETVFEPGKKTLKLYFPSFCSTGIKNVELSGATFANPVQKQMRLLSYGDSITQGYSAVFPSLTYFNRLATRLNAEAINFGIGGERFQPAMIDPDLPFHADLVTVAYGTNDWKHLHAQEFRTRMPAFFKAISSLHAHSPIIVILPIWRGEETDRKTELGTLDDVRNEIRSACESYPNISVLNGQNFLPPHKEFYAPDLLHPNEAGFLLYEENLFKQIKPYLSRLSSEDRSDTQSPADSKSCCSDQR